MEFEYYPHQQKEQQQQQEQQLQHKKKQQQQISVQYQVDPENSMAATNINSTTTGNNSNNNTSTNSNSNNITSSSSNSSTTLTTSTADAATVAIAKDMLQLHHGGALNNNNNNNNVSDGTHALSPTNNIVQTTGAATTTTTTTTASSPVSNHQHHQNPPPAHTAATGVITTGFGATASALAPAPPTAPDNALGQLRFNQDVLYITEPITVIGRNSSTSLVHFHVAENNLVSRKHFQVLYDADAQEFYVQCLSKNGIFVDDFLQRRNADPLKLPARCFFRFPSTEIRILLESFLPTQSLHQHHSGSSLNTTSNNNHNVSMPGNAHVIIAPTAPDDVHHQQQHPHLHHHTQQQSGHVPIHSQPQPPQQQLHHSLHPHQSHLPQQQRASAGQPASGPAPPPTAGAHLLPMEGGNAIYSPLKISIPKKGQKSPYLSPTGTISAANSCPASPRQGFHQNQANYNNYSNNNLQNQDLFQTPSTASYNHNEKPPYSYAQLIVQAISAAPDKQLTLSGIYSFIVKHYPYYRKETNKGWQNSIRHNLSLNRYFIKVARSQDEPGKGSFWRIDPDSGAKLIDHSYKKRRQRSSQGFRPPYGMPRSAPVSPSHMDNSRESSPLQDIVLQSAPGSPGITLENRAAEGDIIYNSQNAHGQTVANNNSHNQYSSGSPYYVTNQNSGAVQQPHVDSSGQGVGNGSNSGGSGGGNSVGALIALKRNHVMAAGAANLALQQQQQQALHPDVIYDDMPTDYSGHMESGDDEGVDNKRPKYVSEVL